MLTAARCHLKTWGREILFLKVRGILVAAWEGRSVCPQLCSSQGSRSKWAQPQFSPEGRLGNIFPVLSICNTPVVSQGLNQLHYHGNFTWLLFCTMGGPGDMSYMSPNTPTDPDRLPAKCQPGLKIHLWSSIHGTHLEKLHCHLWCLTTQCWWGILWVLWVKPPCAGLARLIGLWSVKSGGLVNPCHQALLMPWVDLLCLKQCLDELYGSQNIHINVRMYSVGLHEGINSTPASFGQCDYPNI